MKLYFRNVLYKSLYSIYELFFHIITIYLDAFFIAQWKFSYASLIETCRHLFVRVLGDFCLQLFIRLHFFFSQMFFLNLKTGDNRTRQGLGYRGGDEKSRPTKLVYERFCVARNVRSGVVMQETNSFRQQTSSFVSDGSTKFF